MLEAKRFKLDIVGISQVRWTGCNHISMEERNFIYLCKDSHEYSVALLVHKEIAQAISKIELISERIMRIRINAKPKTIGVIQVYVPMAGSNDDKVEAFYAELDCVLSKSNNGNIAFVMGNFNAKVSQGEHGTSVGKLGLGMRNKRGDRLELADKNQSIPASQKP